MSKRNKQMLQKGSGIYAVLFSAVIGIIILLVFLSVFSLITANSNIPLDNVKYFCLIALLTANFISAVLSAFMNRQLKGLIIGLLTCCVISLLFLLTSVIVNQGSVSSFTLIISIVSVLSGIPGGIIGANLKK